MGIVWSARSRGLRGEGFIRTVAGPVVAVAVLTGCGPSVVDESTDVATVVVGAGDDAASELLARIYAGALAGSGTRTELRTGLGGRADYLAALDAAEVTLVPDYTGRLLRYFAPAATDTDAEDVFEALARSLPDDMAITDYAAAQDRSVLFVSDATAARLGTTELAGIVGRCGELTVTVTGGFEENDGLRDMAERGCVPGRVETDDAPGPAAGGGVAALTTASAAARDATGVALQDAPDRAPGSGPETGTGTEPPVFTAQNVVPVFRKHVLEERQLEALSLVAGELTTADLAEMLDRIGGGEDSAVVAQAWLTEHV
ncbi:putative transporter substrate-binding protein [Rhodococcus aetherivorans]|uniref:Transporter substrate-binding protein n=1 Tax=Rhodococcus aetherivorans TaxID=191292 RepID=A0ABQ0YR36_9NOCA|nr:glycine betaine ABC transporter substrate-binding protein [Rhodococcus aetherivorans]ETT26479.1 ABC-type glycine betaine transport, periplasmic subunit [Rhodococcus rhodochrous ATCC 21198]KDE14305.1 ABC transporter substrate-binding protein [Rhodococcus aetherivorans]MDV6292516.1 glycine betaine ABC transporter substrate-binding protein [Rhodococcus aetherivorans]NGP28799.1 ABC transporter substrate-binding protein [Rhodococcus aetherivorans]UGQ39760.1 ABC transporter substrate-binding prot